MNGFKHKGVTLYYQIVEYIKDKIESGEWEKGYQIPSETNLAEFFKVSRATVRQAISELVLSGNLIRKQGLGTFVSEPSFEGDFLKFYLPEELGDQHKLLSISQKSCSPSIAQKLDLKPGELVTEINRLRFIKGEAAILEVSYLNSKVFLGIEQEDLSQKLYGIMEKKYGYRLVKAQTLIEPVIINVNEAVLLDVAPGSPVLMLTRVCFTHDEKPVILTKSLVRGDKCKLLVSD